MAGNNPNAEHQRFINSQPGNTLEQRENAAMDALRKETDAALRSSNQVKQTIADYYMDGVRGENSIDVFKIVDALNTTADETESREAKQLLAQELEKYKNAMARARIVQRYINHQRALLHQQVYYI